MLRSFKKIISFTTNFSYALQDEITLLLKTDNLQLITTEEGGENKCQRKKEKDQLKEKQPKENRQSAKLLKENQQNVDQPKENRQSAKEKDKNRK